MKKISIVTILFMSMAVRGHAMNMWDDPKPMCESLCPTCEGWCLKENGFDPRKLVFKRACIPHEVVPQMQTRKPEVQEKIKVSTKSDFAHYYVSPVPFKGLTQGLHGHNAVDFRCSYGTPVVAAAAGRICRTGWDGKSGKYIVMEHKNGTETMYAHLSEIYWGQGHEFRQGEVIGFSGQSGDATGPHLHFEIHGQGMRNPFAEWPIVLAAK